jgi:hypothetical protein
MEARDTAQGILQADTQHAALMIHPAGSSSTSDPWPPWGLPALGLYDTRAAV